MPWNVPTKIQLMTMSGYRLVDEHSYVPYTFHNDCFYYFLFLFSFLWSSRTCAIMANRNFISSFFFVFFIHFSLTSPCVFILLAIHTNLLNRLITSHTVLLLSLLCLVSVKFYKPHFLNTRHRNFNCPYLNLVSL